MKSNLCPKCGSHEIIPEVEVRDYVANRHRPLSVAVKLPDSGQGFVIKSAEPSPLTAWVCGQCGYTELYATQFKELLAAHKQSRP